MHNSLSFSGVFIFPHNFCPSESNTYFSLSSLYLQSWSKTLSLCFCLSLFLNWVSFHHSFADDSNIYISNITLFPVTVMIIFAFNMWTLYICCKKKTKKMHSGRRLHTQMSADIIRPQTGIRDQPVAMAVPCLNENRRLFPTSLSHDPWNSWPWVSNMASPLLPKSWQPDSILQTCSQSCKHDITLHKCQFLVGVLPLLYF